MPTQPGHLQFLVGWQTIQHGDIVRGGKLIVFSFPVTPAFYIYDRRNSQFYDDLISRGRHIEPELGIETGQFRSRLKASMWLIQHDVATNLIYGTTLASCLFALLATWLGWIK